MASLAAQTRKEIMAGVAAKPCLKNGKMFANLCRKTSTNNTLREIG